MDDVHIMEDNGKNIESRNSAGRTGWKAIQARYTRKPYGSNGQAIARNERNTVVDRITKTATMTMMTMTNGRLFDGRAHIFATAMHMHMHIWRSGSNTRAYRASNAHANERVVGCLFET
jgi:hypothetical protein